MPLTQIQAGMMDSVAQYYGFKNRIINGAMVIDQRNAGASVTAPVGFSYFVDRFGIASTASSRLSGQRTTIAPSGFINSFGVTSLAATTPASTDDYSLRQVIEGFNVSDFGWGTANAQTVTLSFWVRSSLTGTFAVSFRNSAVNRSYVATYTINAANTFEQKTITIPGDTSGTWLTNNGIGIYVTWDLGQGSSFNTTAGAWGDGNFNRTSACVNFVGTNGATFYITGVQLEEGVTATSFDVRPYGTELQLCQRYYQIVNYRAAFYGAAGNAINQTITHAVVMRATPTAAVITAPTYTNGSTFALVPISDGYSYVGATVTATGATVVSGAVASLTIEL